MTLASLQEKIMNKLDRWKACLLSNVGKEVSIKGVVLSMLIYYMLVLRLPKTFCKEITATVHNVWWSLGTKKRGIHWVRKEELQRSKISVGLGIRDLKLFNSALRAKQAWRFCKTPFTLLI